MKKRNGREEAGKERSGRRGINEEGEDEGRWEETGGELV